MPEEADIDPCLVTVLVGRMVRCKQSWEDLLAEDHEAFKQVKNLSKLRTLVEAECTKERRASK